MDAPAKLTVSLQVTGVRDDGYHLLDSEMVTLDLADTLEIAERRPDGRSHLEVVADWPDGAGAWRDLSVGPVDRQPGDPGAGRRRPSRPGCGWSSASRPGRGSGAGRPMPPPFCGGPGAPTPAVAAGLGADVPFCVAGGRARVSGIGEVVEPLPYEDQSFVLLLPPFGVDTAAVYRAWDRLAGEGRPPEPVPCQRPRGSRPGRRAAARRLARALEDATGLHRIIWPAAARRGSSRGMRRTLGVERPRVAGARGTTCTAGGDEDDACAGWGAAVTVGTG